MKAIVKISLVLLAAMTIASCGKKKQDENIISTKALEAQKPSPVQQMQESKIHNTFKWQGADFTYDIHRIADKSLPVMKQDDGSRYYDNHIDLMIKRGGADFFSKTFTKSTFESYIDEQFKDHGILEGLVFDRTDGGNILFAASVSFPMTDEYIPLIVKISSSGTMSIERDSNLDTSKKAEDGEEEE